MKDLIESLPADHAQRSAALQKLADAAKQVGLALAEMHTHFESGGVMTNESKLSDVNYFLDRNFRKPGPEQQRVRDALGADFDRVRARIEGPTMERFLAAKVPATAYHGDANAGNFILDGHDARGRRFDTLSVVDVGTMKCSIDDAGHGSKTGAADVARFLGSMETLAPGALKPHELAEVREAFSDGYFGEYSKGHDIDRAAYGDAEKWYAVEMQVAVMRSDPRAKIRLLSLLGLEARS